MRVERDIRDRVFRHCARLSPDIVATLGTPELLSRTGYDVEQVSRMMTAGLVFGLRDVLQALALIGLCILIDWRLALVVFVVYRSILAGSGDGDASATNQRRLNPACATLRHATITCGATPISAQWSRVVRSHEVRGGE